MFPFEYFKINPKYLHYEFNYIAFMIRILKSHIRFSFLPDTMSQGSNHGPLRIHKVGDDSIIQSEINCNEYYYFIQNTFPKLIDTTIQEIEMYLHEDSEKLKAFNFIDQTYKSVDTGGNNNCFDKYLNIFRKMEDTERKKYRDYYNSSTVKSPEPYLYHDNPLPLKKITGYDHDAIDNKNKLKWLRTLSEIHRKKQSSIHDIDNFLNTIKIMPTSILEHKEVIDLQ